MKTLILTPIYKRPEIVKLFLEGFWRLKEELKEKIDLICIVSPEDKYLDAILEMFDEQAVFYITRPNHPLGIKKNEGVKFALEHCEFDYLMDLGSDNIINPVLFDIYEPHMKIGKPIIGVYNLHVWDYCKDKFYFIPRYAYENTFGAGRVYHRSILCEDFWPEQNCGMDIGLIKKQGLIDFGIETGTYPVVLDIKTDTNINPMIQLMNRSGKKPEIVHDIKEYFGL